MKITVLFSGPQRRGSQGVMVPLSVDDTDEDVPPGFMQASCKYHSLW